MKVLILCTSERIGGAAVAASRLCEALNSNGVDATMLVGSRQTQSKHVAEVRPRWLTRCCFLWERLGIFIRQRFKYSGLFAIDNGGCGRDITKTRQFREADVIHLHWVSQGFLSLRGIDKILRSGKPVVWTMHDLWPATALCHYARDCQQYHTQCSHCPLLVGGGSGHDLSYSVWNRKKELFAQSEIQFVTCSQWLMGEAKKSGLIAHQSIVSIPNPIDTSVYRPRERQSARLAAGLPPKGRIILFVSQRVTDERKGIAYLTEAVGKLVEAHPEIKRDTSVAILGGHADEVAKSLPLPAHALGYVGDEDRIVSIYNSADVFVTPSLEDNLPNTIMESMACGVPCVGFRVGGIPEMIDHQRNGYVAEFRDAADLARGLYWVLCEASSEALRREAIEKVERCYSQASVSQRYAEVYRKLLNK